MLEIGFPFSDPLADGSSIQYSSEQALKNGFTIEKGFSSLSNIAAETDLPLVIMTYLNIIEARGRQRFLERCGTAGVAGLVVPDLPFDSADGLRRLCREFSIDLIMLTSPTTPPERIRKIASATRGFLYLVSLRGTTGRRDKFPPGTLSYIRNTKKLSPVPALVGFGISGPAMAARAARYSDGVIVGSALVEIIRKGQNIRRTSQQLMKFLGSIRKEIRY